MQDVSEIVRVRDGLVAQLWSTVESGRDAEHTELLARIDTLNWVLSSTDQEPQTVEGPAMTLHSLMSEDWAEEPENVDPEDEPPVAARSTLADTDGPDQSPTPSTWSTIGSAIKRGTDAIIHSTGGLTPTEIISIQEEHETGFADRLAVPYTVRRVREEEA